MYPFCRFWVHIVCDVYPFCPFRVHIGEDIYPFCRFRVDVWGRCGKSIIYYSVSPL